MTPSGIEPATFRLVAQWLNQLRCYREPRYDNVATFNLEEIICKDVSRGELVYDQVLWQVWNLWVAVPGNDHRLEC